MPLILAESDATESGIEYADRTGISYQYPSQYKNIIKSGERFIYYRGRKKRTGGRQPQIYFGTGIIGDVSAGSGADARWRCDILDYAEFSKPVPFKVGKVGYFEGGGIRRGYFQKGVRRISEAEFDAIIDTAELAGGLQPVTTEKVESGGGYASGKYLKEIERYALQVVKPILESRFPNSLIKEQARNNPGFDVLVTHGSGQIFVEVKGTSAQTPYFIITEGEVEFSLNNSAQYCLIVVYEINLNAKTHKVFEHNGAVTEQSFSKRPLQWRCRPTTF